MFGIEYFLELMLLELKQSFSLKIRKIYEQIIENCIKIDSSEAKNYD